MNKKIRVLVVPSDRSGVGVFRSIAPHLTLEKNYPDEFSVDIDYEPKIDDDEWVSKYDIIHYHRTLGDYDKMASTIRRLHKMGILTFMDIDDYWSPGDHHPAHLLIKKSGLDMKILNNIKVSKNIITTSDLFADEIRKYNKSVYVLPNAINPSEKQYTPEPTKSERIRIGWLGGSSHYHDLKLLEGIINKLKSDDLLDKIQFVLCGYDIRGNVTHIDQQTGTETQRKIQPKESVWYEYEKIFTGNFTNISKEYKDYLHKFDKSEYDGIENEGYRRVWTKPITTYASNYNLFDICLAPIEPNIFNKVKSNLKVIEAGFHKKAIIAQKFGPYTIDLTDARMYGGEFNVNGNALMVDTDKNHKQWYQNIKYLVKNPEYIKILGDNLYETVKDTYSINAVTEKRRELYKSMLEMSSGKLIEVTEKA